MTKNEFKKRWDSNDEGGGITYDDIAECAKSWGLYSTPKIHDINKVKEDVLIAAGCSESFEEDLIPTKKKSMAEKTENLVEIKDNKCWVTISFNLNLGNYESVKVESGFSKIIKESQDPLETIDEMQEALSDIVSAKAKQLKKLYKKKRV